MRSYYIVLVLVLSFCNISSAVAMVHAPTGGQGAVQDGKKHTTIKTQGSASKVVPAPYQNNKIIPLTLPANTQSR